MANDWIKMRYDLDRDHRVIQMSRMLAESDEFCEWLGYPVQASVDHAFEHVAPVVIRHLCVSTLLRIWGTVADRAERDGDDAIILNCDEFIIDELVGVPGFAIAMTGTGWLVIEESADHKGSHIARFPDYLKENILADERKSEQRRESNRLSARKSRTASASNQRPVSKASAKRQQKVGPREEKRREEKSAEAIASASTPPAEAAADPIPSDGVRPEGGGELLQGGDATQHLGDFARSVGWVQHEWRDLEALRQTAWSIELGDYPDIGDAAARGDPLAYLRPRLSRYWADRQAEREENPSLKAPSLRKTLEEGRWRIDPTVSNARVSVPQTPKHISPERARALDRLTRRNAS